MPLGAVIHLIPNLDAVEHQRELTCWCNPHETHRHYWVHHSADGREEAEKQHGKKCSAGWTIWECTREIPP